VIAHRVTSAGCPPQQSMHFARMAFMGRKAGSMVKSHPVNVSRTLPGFLNSSCRIFFMP